MKTFSRSKIISKDSGIPAALSGYLRTSGATIGGTATAQSFTLGISCSTAGVGLTADNNTVTINDGTNSVVVAAGGTVVCTDGSHSLTLYPTGSIKQVGGGVTLHRNNQTGTSYLVLIADYYVYCSNTNVVTVTLPAASACTAGQIFIIKGGSNCAVNNLTITRAGADTIDGATTKVISTNYGSYTLISDGISNFELI